MQPWAAEVLQGLYNSLGAINNGQPLGLQEKMRLLVQSPAALEDALACLLGNSDLVLRVRGPWKALWRRLLHVRRLSAHWGRARQGGRSAWRAPSGCLGHASALQLPC